MTIKPKPETKPLNDADKRHNSFADAPIHPLHSPAMFISSVGYKQTSICFITYRNLLISLARLLLYIGKRNKQCSLDSRLLFEVLCIIFGLEKDVLFSEFFVLSSSIYLSNKPFCV